MSRRPRAVGLILGAALAFLCMLSILCDYLSHRQQMAGHVLAMCLLSMLGGGLVVLALASRLFSRAQPSTVQRGQFYHLSHFANTFLFEYRLRSCILTFSDNLPHELGLEVQLEGPRCTVRLRKIVHPDDFHKLWELKNSPPPAHKEVIQELRLLHSNGGYIWYECRVVTLYDKHGRASSLLGRFENIDIRKRREANLLSRSTRDDLTGLLNRSAVTLRVEEWTQSPQAKEGGALFMLDLDDFKNINDTMGHASGDRALLLTARTLQDTFRESDILGRAGGDEFLVFMPGVNSSDLAANRAETLCRALAMRLEEGDCGFSFTCSIGISLYPQDGNSYADLFEAADSAMYQAKREGKNSFRLCSALDR